MPPHAGGLQPLSFCLFHEQESIREATVDIFNELRQHPVCRFDSKFSMALKVTHPLSVVQVGVIFLQALNHFQRYAYVRQAHARESRMRDLSHGLVPPPHLVSRTPSNRSEVSLGGM